MIGFALYGDIAMVQLHNPFDDGKTKARVAVLAVFVVDLVKAVKDAWQVSSGDAAAAVADGDLGCAAAFLHGECECAAAGGVVDGVVD